MRDTWSRHEIGAAYGTPEKKKKQEPVTISLSTSGIPYAVEVINNKWTLDDVEGIPMVRDKESLVKSSIEGTTLDALDNLCILMLREPKVVDIGIIGKYFPTYPHEGKRIMAEHINAARGSRRRFLDPVDRIYLAWGYYLEALQSLFRDGRDSKDSKGEYYTKEELRGFAGGWSVKQSGIRLIENWVNLKREHPERPIFDPNVTVLLGFGAVIQYPNIFLQGRVEFDILMSDGNGFNIFERKLTVQDRNTDTDKLERALMRVVARTVCLNFQPGSRMNREPDTWMRGSRVRALIDDFIDFYYRYYTLNQDGTTFEAKRELIEDNAFDNLYEFGRKAFLKKQEIRRYIKKRKKTRGWRSPQSPYKTKGGKQGGFSTETVTLEDGDFDGI